jgi:ATP-dependent RNA helicase RhlE
MSNTKQRSSNDSFKTFEDFFGTRSTRPNYKSSNSSRSATSQRGNSGRYDREQRSGFSRNSNFSESSGRSYGNRGFGRRFSSGRRGKPARNPIDHDRYIKKAQPSTFEAYTPKHTFKDFNLVVPLQDAISSKGFVTPTPIQDKSIPDILNGHDMIGIADTGTGKTGAFLIPLLNKTLIEMKEKRYHKTLILAPTRELAKQIEDELWKFVNRESRIFTTLCIGGSDISKQISRLRLNNHFVIGTPGRLIDLEIRKAIDFSQFNAIVVDEVDRMLDMGFIDDIESIMQKLPEDRQSLFFSATINSSIQKIINKFSKDPVSVSVSVNKSSDNVDQDIIHVEHETHKLDKLQNLLEDTNYSKVLIFANTKSTTEDIADKLYNNGHKVDYIHGDRPQNKRQRTVDKFKSGYIRVLVATDVAARGLDINNVSLVINWEEPHNYEDYIHRIGRTGRGGKSGVARTFVQK